MLLSTMVLKLFYCIQCRHGMTYGYNVILRLLCRFRLPSGYKVILGGVGDEVAKSTKVISWVGCSRKDVFRLKSHLRFEMSL